MFWVFWAGCFFFAANSKQPVFSCLQSEKQTPELRKLGRLLSGLPTSSGAAQTQMLGLLMPNSENIFGGKAVLWQGLRGANWQAFGLRQR